MRKKQRANVTIAIGQAGDDTGALPTPGTDQFDIIGQVRDTALPEFSKDESEATDLRGEFREYVSSLPDLGEVPLEGWRDYATPDAGQERCREDAGKNIYRNFQVTLYDPADTATAYETVDFVGEVMEFATTLSENETVAFTGRIRARSQRAIS